MALLLTLRRHAVPLLREEIGMRDITTPAQESDPPENGSGHL
jgi:hypothetical protein